MSYDYADQRAEIFTEHGVVQLLEVRDNVLRLTALAGAVRLQEACRGVSGSSWVQLAVFDYLVERGELVELTGPDVAGQHRIFRRKCNA